MTYKAYVFVNSKVCGNQTGIQAAHAIARLVHKRSYRVSSWMANETLVLLNGGTDKRMHEILDILIDNSSAEHIALFREPDMSGLLTAVAYIPSDAEDFMAREIRAGVGQYDINVPSAAIANLIATTHTHRG